MTTAVEPSSIATKSKAGTKILHGQRDPRTNLWTLPLQTSIGTQPALPPNPLHQAHIARQIVPPAEDNVHTIASLPNQAHSAYHMSTQTEIIQFLHTTCGSLAGPSGQPRLKAPAQVSSHSQRPSQSSSFNQTKTRDPSRQSSDLRVSQ
jgi:hypothetical protein